MRGWMFIGPEKLILRPQAADAPDKTSMNAGFIGSRSVGPVNDTFVYIALSDATRADTADTDGLGFENSV
jgi:hypothetical protein